MTVLPDSIPRDCHPRIRELVEYWLAIHPAEGLPGRQHFDPLDIPSLLPNVFLVNLNPGEPAFTFRLLGTRTADLYGRDLTGQPFENAYEDGRSAPPYRDACRMVYDKMPRWRRAPASFRRSHDFLTMERVLLPLAADGLTVDILLGLVLAETRFGQVL